MFSRAFTLKVSLAPTSVECWFCLTLARANVAAKLEECRELDSVRDDNGKVKLKRTTRGFQARKTGVQGEGEDGVMVWRAAKCPRHHRVELETNKAAASTYRGGEVKSRR